MLAQLEAYHQDRLAAENAPTLKSSSIPGKEGFFTEGCCSIQECQKDVAVFNDVIFSVALDAEELEALTLKQSGRFTLDEVQGTVLVTATNPDAALPVLRNMCRTSDGQRKCAECGGIEAIVALVSQRCSLHHALPALEAASMLNISLQEIALAAGAASALVGIMHESTDASIVAMAAQCVGTIAYRSGACQKGFIQAGASDELVRQLNLHPSDAFVQRSACYALYRLSCDAGSPEQQRVGATVGLEEAIRRAADQSMSDEACWFKMHNFLKSQHGGA